MAGLDRLDHEEHLLALVDPRGQQAGQQGSADGSTPISGAQVLDAVPTSGKDGNWTSGATVSVLVPSAQGSSAAALGASGNAAVVVTAAGQPIGDH